MLDAVRLFLEEHKVLVGWLVSGSAVLLVLSVVTLPVVAVLLPADLLQRLDREPGEALPADDWRRRHPAARWTLRVLKNLAGGVLALLGLAMLVLPGQGLITLVLALLLLDLPGKRALERRLLNHPRVLKPLNALRRKFGRDVLRA